MTAAELADSAFHDDAPPAGISTGARALWLAKAGKWDAAHDLCQEVPGAVGAWIHAHLHREEGDLSNAGYWYDRAGKRMSGLSLADEWAEIAAAMLADD